jgi:hypothetical protein
MEHCCELMVIDYGVLMLYDEKLMIADRDRLWGTDVI